MVLKPLQALETRKDTLVFHSLQPSSHGQGPQKEVLIPASSV